VRQALLTRPQAQSRQEIARGASIPAPTGGWNAISPLAGMPKQDAVLLDNFTPRPGYVEARRGFIRHAYGLSAPVQTLMAYRGADDHQLFAVSGGDLYAADAGAFGAPLVSSLNSPRWQYVNFSNAAGIYLLAFSGADTPLKYDGSSWTTNTITGPTSSTLIDVMVHKRRVFMAQKDSLSVWYLDVEAISGAASELDLGPIFSLGGTLACMGTWTVDGGAGPDDLAVFVTTQGQVAVYQGLDPADANEWSLIGVFTLGKPLGRRSLLQYGSDLVLLTVNGVIPMTQAAVFDRAQQGNVALTAKVQNAFAQAVALYQDNFGWDAFLYPNSQLAIYNIPVTTLGTSYQFVQNLQTGAWARYKGVNAFCWAYSDGRAYFGGRGGVFAFDTSSADDGEPITCDVTTAFQSFGAARNKQFTMIRPILRAPSGVMPAIDVLVDYREGIPTSTPTVAQASGMVWGAMIWGSMVWSSLGIRQDWTTVGAIGYVGAARMRVVLSAPAVNFEILLEDGSGGIELENGTGVILMEDSLYPEVTCQLIGFDLMLQGAALL